MPAVRAFDDPAPGRVPSLGRRGRGRGLPATALMGRMHHVAANLSGLARLIVVEAFVPTQVLRVAGRGPRPRDYHAVQGGFGQLHIGAVGSAEDHAQGSAAAIAQHMPLGAPLAAIGRSGARRVAAEGGKEPLHYRSLARSSRSGARHRSGAIARPTAASTRPAASTPESGRGSWSPPRTHGGRPST